MANPKPLPRKPRKCVAVELESLRALLNAAASTPEARCMPLKDIVLTYRMELADQEARIRTAKAVTTIMENHRP